MQRKRMSAEQRRGQITKKAADLFSRQGFARTKTREIASAAGVTEAVIYKHFGSKEELYDATIDHFMLKVIEIRNIEILGELPTLSDVFLEMGRHIIKFAEENTDVIRLVLYSALQEHRFTERFFLAGASPAIKMICEIIDKAKSEGIVRNDIDTFKTVFSFLGSLVFFNLTRLIAGVDPMARWDTEEYLQNTVKTIVNGISLEEPGENS